MNKDKIKEIMNKAFNSDFIKKEFHEIEDVEVKAIFPYIKSGVVNFELIISVNLKPEAKWHVSRRVELQKILTTLMKMLGYYGNDTQMFIETKKGEE